MHHLLHDLHEKPLDPFPFDLKIEFDWSRSGEDRRMDKSDFISSVVKMLLVKANQATAPKATAVVVMPPSGP